MEIFKVRVKHYHSGTKNIKDTQNLMFCMQNVYLCVLTFISGPGEVEKKPEPAKAKVSKLVKSEESKAAKKSEPVQQK